MLTPRPRTKVYNQTKTKYVRLRRRHEGLGQSETGLVIKKL